MPKPDGYKQLERRVEVAQQEADKAEGAFDELMKQLKRNFNCKTLVEAKRERKVLIKQDAQNTKIFEKALAEFEENWPDESV